MDRIDTLCATGRNEDQVQLCRKMFSQSLNSEITVDSIENAHYCEELEKSVSLEPFAGLQGL
jgi:hypothetical protein